MAKKKSTDNFYRAFEERYRGPRELIKSRLQVYVPFVEPLKAAYAGGTAVDLGCGRGEWLELVNELGFDGVGVDMDEGMLAACHDLDLNVEHREAVAYLKSLPDASTAIVSGFHVAEHIVFSELQSLVQEALRVLRPGGLLILETPNPENILVAGVNFYLDPTHQRPIPPQLLSFLPEHYGFARVKILRLQEAAGLADSNALTLLNVLNGVSPDYAVVAQKTGSDDILAATEPAFTAEYGISLDTLAEKYEQQRKTMAQELQARAEIAEIKTLLIEANSSTERAEAQAQHALAAVQHAQAQAATAEARATQAEAALETTRKELHDTHQANHHHWQLAEARHQQIQSLLGSTSWRMTAPLRWLGSTLHGLSLNALKPRAKVLLQHACALRWQAPTAQECGFKSSASSNPMPVRRGLPAVALRAWSSLENYQRLRLFILGTLSHFPMLNFKLRRMYAQSMIESQLPATNWVESGRNVQPSGTELAGGISQSTEASSEASLTKSFKPLPLGMNAAQRTPLEANLFDYLERL